MHFLKGIDYFYLLRAVCFAVAALEAIFCVRTEFVIKLLEAVPDICEAFYCGFVILLENRRNIDFGRAFIAVITACAWN